MATSTSFVPTSELLASDATGVSGLPRDCTFTETDWRALAPFWYPVASSHEVTDKPVPVRLLDQRVVVYRLSDGAVCAAKDICFHRGVPLSLGHIEGDEIICKYHGLRYDREGKCTCTVLVRCAGESDRGLEAQTCLVRHAQAKLARVHVGE
jgi:phenylpropionate dioxygenase-like ring-hydroxylating dioxygenase large terminal subunit